MIYGHDQDHGRCGVGEHFRARGTHILGLGVPTVEPAGRAGKNRMLRSSAADINDTSTLGGSQDACEQENKSKN